MPTATPTTCQICGRPIKIGKGGLISHHGYKRPGYGWQTSSCRGARELPYEISCDLIPKIIQEITLFIQEREAWIVTLETTPPAFFLVDFNRSARGRADLKTVTRPEGFQPRHAVGGTRPRSYECAYAESMSNARMHIKGAAGQIEYLTKRLADWKAPDA